MSYCKAFVLLVINEIVLKGVRHLEGMSFREWVGHLRTSEPSRSLRSACGICEPRMPDTKQPSLSLPLQSWDPLWEHFLNTRHLLWVLWEDSETVSVRSWKKPMVPRRGAENPLLCSWPCGVGFLDYLLEKKNRTSCWEKVSSAELTFWKTTGYGIGLYYSFQRLKKKKSCL